MGSIERDLGLTANFKAASYPNPVFEPVTRTVLPSKEMTGSFGGFLTAQREIPFAASVGGVGPRSDCKIAGSSGSIVKFR